MLDIEPVLHMILGVPQPRVPLLFGGYTPTGLHMITHNPFAVIVLIASSTTILARASRISQTLLVDYPQRRCARWDLTMHGDINLGFPFTSIPNPFVDYTVLAIIGLAGVVTVLLSYFIGNKNNRGSPFEKLP